MKKSLQIGILALLAFGNINAQNWVKTSAPDNIQYQDIRTYGKDIIYAFGKSANETTAHTLVSSFDGGQTWTVGTFNYLWTYVVATPAGLIVGDITSNPKSHYTADGGQTWNNVAGSETGYFFPNGILPNGKLLYSDQIFGKISVSPDYISLGTTYSTSVSGDFTKFAVNPSGRIIFGHDGGNYDLAYSDDNGATLTNISLTNIIGSGKHAAMITSAQNNVFYTAGVNTDVLKSMDNGASWAACTNIPGGVYILSIKANQSGRLVVSKSGRIIVTSTDGGQTFTDLTNGIPALGNGKLETTTDGKFWLAFTDGANGATTGGIYVLQDNMAVSETNKKTFGIYPNPAKDFVNLNNLSKNATVKITDASGKLIYTSVSKDTNLKISISNFTNGIYFIEVNENGKMSSNKFIVRK